MTHAPEPWSNPHGSLIVDADHHAVARVNGRRPDAGVNLRLIQRAPELLKLAKIATGFSHSAGAVHMLVELIKEIEG